MSSSVTVLGNSAWALYVVRLTFRFLIGKKAMTNYPSSKLDYAAGGLMTKRQASRIAGSALILCVISFGFVVLTQPLIHDSNNESVRLMFFLRLLLGGVDFVMLLFAGTWVAVHRKHIYGLRFVAGGLIFLVFLMLFALYHFVRVDFNNAWRGFR